MTEPRYKKEPYAHQREDVPRLCEPVDPAVGRVIPRAFLLAYEQRVGKTKTVIDAAQLLFERGEIDRVLVITLNGVKSEWYDPEFGQVAENLWDGLPARVWWMHSKVRRWERGLESGSPGVGLPLRVLDVFVTNYDFARSKAHLPHLLKVCDARTALVLDESAAVGNYSSAQHRAVFGLRQRCGWVYELNGTPIGDSPRNVYGQMRVLDRRILGVRGWMEFRATYAITFGPHARWISGWKNLDELSKKVAPYVIRRLKKDCLDLPPKLPPVTLTATLSDATWKIYKDLRDEFVHYLRSGASVTAAQAVVRAGRLAQITSGILGGVVTVRPCDCADPGPQNPYSAPDAPMRLCRKCDGIGFVQENEDERVISNEKIDTLMDFLRLRWSERPDLRVIIWCRFKNDVTRVVDAIKAGIGIPTCKIVGDQKKEERDAALRAFHPSTANWDGPAALVSNPKAGGIGLNLAAASVVVHLSHWPSLYVYDQSNERPHGPGQREAVEYYDIVAEGPDGQRTADHKLLRALRDKKNVADALTTGWEER